MSSKFEGLTKRFVIHGAGTQIKGKESVLKFLKGQKDEKDTEYSVLKSDVGKAGKVIELVFWPGKKAGAVESGLSPIQAAAYIDALTGGSTVRQTAEGAHTAFNEKNIRAAYSKVLDGIAMAKGKTRGEVHDMFLDYLNKKTGVIKGFNAAALTLIASKVYKKKKDEVTPDDRINVFSELATGRVTPATRSIIQKEGYDYEKFLAVAKAHHFVHYINRQTPSGASQYVLRKKSGRETLGAKANAKAVRDGELEPSPRGDWMLVDYRKVAEKGEKSEFTIAVHTGGGGRGEDKELDDAKAYLKDKVPDSIIGRLTHKDIKELAEFERKKAAAAQ